MVFFQTEINFHRCYFETVALLENNNNLNKPIIKKKTNKKRFIHKQNKTNEAVVMAVTLLKKPTILSLRT